MFCAQHYLPVVHTFHETCFNKIQPSSCIHSIKYICSFFFSVSFRVCTFFLLKKKKSVSVIYQLLRNVCIKICFIVNIWYQMYQCTFIPYPECTALTVTPHAQSSWLTSFQPCKNRVNCGGFLLEVYTNVHFLSFWIVSIRG